MINSGEILRGATRRFFPAAVVGALATMLAFDAPALAAAMWVRVAIGSVGAAVLATLGFASAMILTRRYMRLDAGVAGRKSAVAGFVAAGAAFTLLSLSDSFLVMRISLLELSLYHIGRTLAIPVLAGVVATVALYFPWFSRTPEEITEPNRSADMMTGAARFMLRRRTTRSVRQPD